MSVRTMEAQLWSPVLCITRINVSGSCSCSTFSKRRFLLSRFSSKYGWFSVSYGLCLKFKKHSGSSQSQKVMSCSERIRQHVSVVFVGLFTTMLLVTSVSLAVTNIPSCEFNFFNKNKLLTWNSIISRFP